MDIHEPVVPVMTPAPQPSRPGDSRGERAHAVAFRGVTRRFGPIMAVDRVDLAIDAGETIALLGPNGAGKSTAIALMLGLLDPSDGSVTTLGLPPRTAVANGRVGAMLQAGGLPARARIGELIDLARSLYPRPLELATILERAGLQAMVRRSVEGLSGGESQRVRFALAIAGDPDLLFLDEPTVAMDVETRRSFWSDIRRATADGRTVLFATHYLQEADQVADRVIVLDRGRIVADGTARAIRASVSGRTVRFDLPSAASERGRLAAFPGVTEVSIQGVQVRLRTSDGDGTLRALVRSDLPAHDIEVTSAGLEAAFLSLVAGGPSTSEEIVP